MKAQTGSSLREGMRVAVFLGILILLVGLLFNIPRIGIPLMIGYLIYLVAQPAIPGLMKFGLSRSWSIGALFCGLIFLMTWPIVKLVPTVKEELRNVEYYAPKIESYLEAEYLKLRDKIKDETGYELSDEYPSQLIQQGRQITKSVIFNAPKFLANMLEWYFLIPLFVFFLLRDAKHLRRLILKVTPNSIFERYYDLSHQFNKQLGDYIFAKGVEAAIVGVTITLGLWIMDVRFSLLLGLVAAVTNIIPYLGPILGAVPALIFALSEYGLGTEFGGILILYIIANAIDIALVFPVLVSKIVDLHPVVVVLSVILGSQYLGIVGMIISIPTAAALKLVFKEFYRGGMSRRTLIPD